MVICQIWESIMNKPDMLKKILSADNEKTLMELSIQIEPITNFFQKLFNREYIDGFQKKTDQILDMSSIMVQQLKMIAKQQKNIKESESSITSDQLDEENDLSDSWQQEEEEQYRSFIYECENLKNEDITDSILKKLINARLILLDISQQQEEEYEINKLNTEERKKYEEFENERYRAMFEEDWTNDHKDDFNNKFTRIIDSIDIDLPIFDLHQHFFTSQLILVYSLFEKTILDLVEYHCLNMKDDCRAKISLYITKHNTSPVLENRIRAVGIDLELWKHQEIYWLRTLRNQLVHNIIAIPINHNMNRVQDAIHYFDGIVIKNKRIYLSNKSLAVFIKYAVNIVEYIRNKVL